MSEQVGFKRNVGLFMAVMIGIGVASLIGVDVGEKSRVAGRLIKDISIPADCSADTGLWRKSWQRVRDSNPCYRRERPAS